MAEEKTGRARTRPLPKTDEPDTRDFWAATGNRELRYQQCRSCNTLVFYPRGHCTGCTSGDLEWKSASGRATVYSYSVVRQSYHPYFRSLVPYVVAWIDLQEGPRILSNVIGVEDPLADLAIGQQVELVWEEHEELCIPLFRPVSS